MTGVEATPFGAVFAPVAEERTVERPLPVDGAVPPVLEGLLVRNGPNAPDPAAGARWCDGPGMVHAVELREGRAVAYVNRAVRTATGRALAGPGNLHAVAYGEGLLAFGTRGLPYRLTVGLATLGPEDFGGAVSSAALGHPLPPGPDGGLAIEQRLWEPAPVARLVELDAGGSVAGVADVALARPTAPGATARTVTRALVFDLPALIEPGEPGEPGQPGQPGPQGRDGTPRWEPEAGASVGVLARGRPGDEVRWVETEPCWVSHVANAYDDPGGDPSGDAVVVDVCCCARYPEWFGPEWFGEPRPVLERWRIADGRVERSQVDERAVELPRTDGTLAGRPHRFVYCAEVAGDGAGGLVRYDLVRDEAVRWDPGPHCVAGEPVFVRDPDGHADDEGWILSVVYDAERDASDLVVIDGSSWGGRPDAIVHLPARVPAGLHGSWVPAARLR